MTDNGKSRRILVVEDNSLYKSAAGRVLRIAGVSSITYASKYNEIPSDLNERFDGIFCDLFFPSGEDNDFFEGKLAIRKMIETDSKEKHIIGYVEAFDPFIQWDPDINQRVRNLAANSNYESAESNPVFRALRQVASTLEGQTKKSPLITQMLRNVIPLGEQGVDIYERLKDNMAVSGSEPLGILVGERAKNQGVPCAFVTDSNHHDLLTQPLVDYISRERLGKVIDCDRGSPEQKTNNDFWLKAYRNLEGIL